MVSPDGTPLPGATLRVLGRTRESHARDWRTYETSGELPPPLVGSWPIFEFDGTPLAADAEGRIVAHQMDDGIQFSTSYRSFFGIRYQVSDSRPPHALEFRCAGYEPRRLDFLDLDRRSHAAVNRTAAGPHGIPVSRVAVRVVLDPE